VRDIFWIKSDSPAALAIVLRPQGGRWLEMDLRRMKQEGIETLVSLLEEDEAAYLGLAEEGAVAARNGIQFLSHPIPDANTPQRAASFRAFVAELADRLRGGEHIGIHCRGSIGRSSVTAACALIELGWKPEAALATVEAARGCPVPDTPEQKRWILRYKPRG
jgi:protein-tyrosine phosphatase